MQVPCQGVTGAIGGFLDEEATTGDAICHPTLARLERLARALTFRVTSRADARRDPLAYEAR